MTQEERQANIYIQDYKIKSFSVFDNELVIEIGLVNACITGGDIFAGYGNQYKQFKLTNVKTRLILVRKVNKFLQDRRDKLDSAQIILNGG